MAAAAMLSLVKCCCHGGILLSIALCNIAVRSIISAILLHNLK